MLTKQVTAFFEYIMDYYSMTDKVIGAEIGARLKALRLRRNRTQQDAAAVSLNAIKALEAGKGQLSSRIAVLCELEALEGVDQFILTPEVSPLQLAKQRGKKWQRTSGTRGDTGSGEMPEW